MSRLIPNPAIVLLAAMAAAGAIAARANEASCIPPSSMESKLKGKPSADTLNELGVWFADRKEFACASQAFATSLQLDPQQPPFRRVIFMFGASLYFAGDTAEAAEALEEAERVGYRDARLYSMLATALDTEHEPQKAEAQWKLALAFDPESPVVLDALSNDMIALGQYQDVTDLLSQRSVQALRSERQVGNLAFAEAQLGRAEDAANVLEDGLNTYPDSQPIADALVSVLTALHRDGEAATVRNLAEARRNQAAESAR